MSGNVKTINSSNQDNLVYEEWHKDHRRFIAHCLKTGKFSDVHSRFLLLGTPNVGKSTFFNKLTTATAMVSNIDRLTVADTLGRFKSNKAYVLIDLPGIYNLSHPIDEESVVAHEILHDHYQKIVNIVGAQSLARDLLLTIQSIEVGKLSTLVVNMTDEVTSGVIDYKKLSKLLNNVSVVPTQANRGLGIKEAETSLINDQTVSPVIVKYSPLIEKLIMKISHILPSIIPAKRFYALMILEKNQYVLDRIKKYFNQEYQSINKLLTQYKKHDFYQEIYQIRKKKIASIVNQVVNHSLPYLTVDKVRQHKIDRILLNKPIGITLFFLMVMAIYYISFGPYTGGYLQSQLD
jgi:ferrous iron transport protein B